MRLALICLVFIACECRRSRAAAPAEKLSPTFRMFEDPLFEYPSQQQKMPPKIVDVWRSALDGTDSVYQFAAATDVRDAHRKGFKQVAAAIPELRKLLRGESTEESVRIAAAQALIELDARSAAEELFGAAQTSGSQFRLLVEPALAAWDYRPIRDVWRDRLGRPSTRRRELILACDGSGRVRDAEALIALTKIVHSPDRPRDVRWAAARAAGEIASQGLEDDVRSLLANGNAPLIDRLCAVSLLRRHDSEPARQLLVQLFHDPAGPIAAAAIRRLYEIDPALVLDLADAAWAHPDVDVRRVAAECWISLPTRSRLKELSPHLNDPNPSLRSRICGALFEFSQQPQFASAVREDVAAVLHSDGWRAQEQACLLLGEIDYEPVAMRLVELLESGRSEVAVTSAWALRKVAVADTLPAMLDKAQRQTDHPQGDHLPAVDQQVAHLFEGMTLMNYKPAIPLMKRHVPKEESHRILCRGAAVWGLGYLMAGQKDEKFEAQLMGRVNDDIGMPPEIEIVCRMSAISLGRLKAVSQLQALKEKAGPVVGSYPIGFAYRWAIHEISGETLPMSPLEPDILRDWRLQALKR